MRVVSYSLWGDNPKYNVGALRNAELVSELYPGWQARFYVGTNTPSETLSGLIDRGAHVIDMNKPGDWTGMFWRFEAASDPDVDVMISRDCDSRITAREVAAVKQWLGSNAMFHIMRDHPHHATEILGGMWGARAPLLSNMSDLIREYVKGDFWQVDQNFLREVVYPKVSQFSMVHDEFFQKIPFPTKRLGDEFVGLAFDENNVAVEEQKATLRDTL
jgi:protein O-GlcNAc transferase